MLLVLSTTRDIHKTTYAFKKSNFSKNTYIHTHALYMAFETANLKTFKRIIFLLSLDISKIYEKVMLLSSRQKGSFIFLRLKHLCILIL